MIVVRVAGKLRHCVVGLSAIVAATGPLAAQSNVPQSRAVVQPLPPAGVQDLNTALMRLARNTRDLGALIDAGNASLKLNDIDAAIGFFGRADELSPGNPQVKVGLAAAFVRSERPIEALRLFHEAERAGASTAALAGDRGLAYDLVGDPAAAQQQYARAFSASPNDELTRRMALSQAISGNRAGFEKTLYPLLERRDFAAYRTRAFGLAILGEEGEAVAIAQAVMPADLSARIIPYLRYMDRLTKAQQAAAGNLGIFPRASQIGRDDARVAQYANGSGPATTGLAPTARVAAIQGADAGLAPQGAPLGPAKADRTSQRRRPDRGRSAVHNVAAGAVPAAPAQAAAQPSARPAISPVVAASPVPKPAARPAPAPAAMPPVETVQALPASAAAKPGFDLAQVNAGSPAASSSVSPRGSQNMAVVQPIPAAAPTPATPPLVAAASVADAFAGFTLSAVTPDKTGAVDITAIKPPREIVEPPAPKPAAKPAPKPVAKPEPPKAPSRVWVQVATGRDRKALAFDWRRISRKAPEVLGAKAKKPVKPHVAAWGQTSRLLAGPFSSEKDAQDAVTTLKADGIDSFTFTSAVGEEVEPLPKG